MRQHYPPAYAYLWDDDGDWYVSNMYSLDKLEVEFADPQAELYQVLYQGDAVGYCKVIREKSPENGPAGRYFYLQRLYLATEVQGMGIGGKVMDYLIERARTEGYDYIWLETMEIGASRRFYERLDFEIIGKIRLPFPGMVEETRGLLAMVKLLGG